METALTYAVLAVVGARLVAAARVTWSPGGRATVLGVLRSIRWGHVWPVPIVLAAVIGVASLLIEVPGLDWGWWTALGGQGNPVTGTTDRTAGTVWEWLVPLVFLLLVLPSIPLFARAEERMFRLGAESWSWRRRLLKVFAFGLVHAVIGIPIGVALALSLGGAYFMAVYLHAFRRSPDQRTALMASTAAHTTYNFAILGLVLVYVVLVAFGAA